MRFAGCFCLRALFDMIISWGNIQFGANRNNMRFLSIGAVVLVNADKKCSLKIC